MRTSDGSCQPCPAGLYAQQLVCQPCVANCFNCSNGELCDACQANYTGKSC